MPRFLLCARTSLMAAALLCGLSPAQSPVQPATYVPSKPTEVTVAFARRAPRRGDQTEQQVTVETNLITRKRRGADLLEESPRVSKRFQQRMITTRQVQQGLARVGEVHYQAARRWIGETPHDEPVAGKQYLVHREAEELNVTLLAGGIPPMEEHQIVLAGMQAFGLANPLAGYLAGKSIQVGERLTLPPEVADQLLGLDSTMGKTERFELKLEAVANREGRRLAIFRAEIDAAEQSKTQMRLFVEGRLEIDTATCRAESIELSGPIGMSEVRFSPEGTVLIQASGKLRVAVASKYRDAR